MLHPDTTPFCNTFFAKVFLAKSLCSSFNKIRKWVVLVQNLLASIKSTLWSFHLSPLFLCQLADLQLLACVFRAIHRSTKPSHFHFIEPESQTSVSFWHVQWFYNDIYFKLRATIIDRISNISTKYFTYYSLLWDAEAAREEGEFYPFVKCCKS